MLRVFKQLRPIPTGQKFTTIDRVTGQPTQEDWHRAVFVEVGRANTWEEAKKLWPWPIVDGVFPE